MRRIIGAVLVLGTLALAGCGSGSASDSGSTTTAAKGTDAPETTTTSEAAVPEDAEPTCAYAGVDQIGNMLVELTAITTSAASNLKVTYVLRDGEGGTRFFDGTDYIPFPREDEAFRVRFDTFEAVPNGIDEATIACEVLDIESDGFYDDAKLPSDSDRCTFIAADEADGIQVEVDLTSPFLETRNLQVWWAVEAPGPVRFSTGNEGVGLVGAGESVRVSGSTLEVLPEWLGDSEVTCTVLGIVDQGT